MASVNNTVFFWRFGPRFVTIQSRMTLLLKSPNDLRSCSILLKGRPEGSTHALKAASSLRGAASIQAMTGAIRGKSSSKEGFERSLASAQDASVIANKIKGAHATLL